jgi:alginate O-acetyltransferase complex protein AlgI
MFFDTPIYFLFLTLVVLAYWRLARKSQNLLLLAASYLFYGWWDWRFLLLIWISTCVDFYLARWMDRLPSSHGRRTLLVLSLLVNFGFLGFFKYFDFFVNSFADLLAWAGVENVNRPLLKILLPPGISFYTFQEVAYIVDVYRKRMKPAKSLIDYALFICLFPHLIAGPIQQPSHLLPQVQSDRQFNSERFFNGLMLILCGLFRKCVVADNAALIADMVFAGKWGEPTLPIVALGAYAFAWQIYADFSGYSDMARGSAQLMGFHFMVNFRQPYLATSLQDFWRRWHISLSTWLRDYVYVSLGGNRHGEPKTYRNLLLTMLLGGLWHGANWTFVVWGMLHGVWLAVERAMRSLGRGLRLEKSSVDSTSAPSMSVIGCWARRVFVFHLVCFTWIFFRAQSLEEAQNLLAGITRLGWHSEHAVALKFLAFFILPLLVMDLINERRSEEYLLERAAHRWRLAIAGLLLIAITFFSGNQLNAFIYFQF